MNDPSDGVPQMLLYHVHLISTHQYPYEPAMMPMDKALSYLLQAPKIVRDMQPVAWQYLSPPPGDGKVFLMWQPISKLGAQFATDGYVWSEAENLHMQHYKGHTIEIMVHEAGFNPGVEQMATHRRMRYRLTAGPNGLPVDPTLEIVHYLKAFPEHQLNARQVRPHPQFQKWMGERKFLESQGALVRKNFMLHDSVNWPKLNMPGAVPGNPYQANMMYGAGRGAPPPPGAQGPYAQRPGMPPNAAAAGAAAGGMGPSPAKRARTSTSRPAPPGMAVGMPNPEDAVFADEEMLGIGDSLDLLTAREISETRYKQHHEWMEEILSSPYATGQIKPHALTLGFMGELQGLTDGILVEKPEGPNGIPKPRAVGPEQVAALEKRVNAFLKKSEDEVATMRSQHTKRLDEFSRQKLFADLERRLASIPHDGSGDDKIENVVHDAEEKTGTTLTTGENIVQVSKGGILTAEEQLEALRHHQAANAPEPQPEAALELESKPDGADETNITDAAMENLIDTDINMDLNPNEDPLGNGDSHDVFNTDSGDNDFPEFANLDTAGDALEMYSEEYGSFNPS